MIAKAAAYLKKEVVLTAAWVLAIISAFIVPPSKGYVDYIDFRSLGILWSLMVIMQMFKQIRVFEVIGQSLLKKTKKLWQLAAVLVFLCFFSSMFITNDVALITFVPFSIMMLKECGKEELMIPVIVLQTIAANLGSMMTPVGNPQNLYLYGLSDMGIGSFVALVAPYTLISGILLAVFIFTIKGKNEPVETAAKENVKILSKTYAWIYAALFVLALLVVARVMPYTSVVAFVLLITTIFWQETLKKVDYALLATFVGFFIFTGNMGHVPAIAEALQKMVAGHEVVAGVVCSQVISNVPAALLISDFAQDLNSLILGVNFGGLGTLIASMASLISYKLFAAECPDCKGRYMVHFTVMNILFLVVLMAAWLVLR